LTAAFNEMADAVTVRQAAQKKAEEDLFELASTLEERVEKRTEELALANRVKSQFLANMSHEIRTPMNGVLGMLELLLEDDLSPKHQRLAQTAFRSGESLLNIVNGVLDLSKIEAGKLHLSSEPFNLQRMIEESVELFAGAARSKKINLAHLLSENTPRTVIGDEGRVRQVLTNVLGNAVKFTAAGEVVLYVNATDLGSAKTRIDFTVRDTGIGISRDKQHEIFDAFSQADGSTTRLYGGTGLGLNIARQLCEMMGGSIGVESERGHGSVFRFSVVVGTRTGAGKDVVDAWSGLKGKSALVVDDNPTNREILENYLARVGVRSQLLTNAEAALGVLRDAVDKAAPFDFVLIDGVQPTMDGFELARRIKAVPALAALRLIILTSSDDVPDVAATDHERWLVKPIRRSELYECLSRLSLTAGVADTLPGKSGAPTTGTPAIPSFTGCRVLLVEDNEVNMMVSKSILFRQGCVVTTAVDGLKALAEYDKAEFDLILMDCQMPEMDGFEATASIRAREATSHRHTPIVALTANAIEGDREHCLRTGMDDYLSKPVSRDAMRTMLARWAGGGATAAVTVEPAVMAQTPRETVTLSEASLKILRDLEADGDPGIIRQIMRVFLDNSPGLLEKLRQGSAGRDADALRTASHTLKSTSAVIGAIALAECCARLETSVRAGQIDDAIALIDDVMREYRSVQPAVERAILAATKSPVET
jgi:signal transduction histidine kinase/CheY-like chemotaxis protein/HPt (histidine-containing phosphotransfer) domain-containing protein